MQENDTQKIIQVLDSKQFIRSATVEHYGFSKNTLSNWRTGKSEPSTSKLRFFVNALGFNYSDLVKEAKLDEFA